MSGTTTSKMAAHQWAANHVTVGPQLAEMVVINHVRTLVMQGRPIRIRELADEVGVSIG